MLLFPGMKYAQQNSVPIEVQSPLLMKVISFNRNVAQINSPTFVIGVVYQSHNKYSKNIKEELEDFIDNTPATIGNKRVEFVYLDLDKDNIRSILSYTQVHALYITPLRAYDIAEILAATRELKILSLTGVESYVEKGVSVGIGQKSDKPLILINLNACKSEGVNFSSQLLKLSKIIE